MVYIAIGTGLHSGISFILKNKKRTGELGNLDDMIEASITSFTSEIADGVQYDDLSNNINTSNKQIEKISRAYFKLVAPEIKPVEVEKYLPAKIGDEFLLTGHPDVIESNSIRDFKSGQIKPFQAQVGGYSLLSKSHKIAKPKKLIIDHIPRPNLKNGSVAVPKKIEYPVAIAEKEAKNVVTRIKGDITSFVESGNVNTIPCNPMSNLCSVKYCPVHGSDFCPITKGV